MVVSFRSRDLGCPVLSRLVPVVITGVRAQSIQLPLRERFRTAVRETDVIDAIEISIETDGDPRGIGYATATPAITGDSVESITAHLAEIVSPLLIGAPINSISDAQHLIDAMQLSVRHCSSAVAGVDQALRALQNFFRTDATGESASVVTSVTLSAAGTDEMVAAAQRRLDLGFCVIKAKLGRDPDTDATRMITLARELEGKAEFWVDANQGWTFDQTLKIIDAAAAANALPTLLEQPVAASALTDLAAIAARVPMPVCADESARHLGDIDRIADVGAIAMVNLKFMKFGGRTGTEAAAKRARANGLSVLVGSMMEHPSSVADAVRFAATLTEPVHDLDAGWWAADPTSLTYHGGCAQVSS